MKYTEEVDMVRDIVYNNRTIEFQLSDIYVKFGKFWVDFDKCRVY